MYEFKHKKQSVKPTLTPDQQFLWEERVAICIVDGHLTIEQAQKIAWEQVASNSKNCKISAQLTCCVLGNEDSCAPLNKTFIYGEDYYGNCLQTKLYHADASGCRDH